MTPKAIRRVAAWARRRQRRAQEPHGLVLMYHRVARVAADPWNIAVSPEHFESQVKALCEQADVVPLTELHCRLRAGRGARPVVAITFDDGNLDNLTAAKPILVRYGAPATVFVATGYTGSRSAFWWDRLSQLLLTSKSLPTRLDLGSGQELFRWTDVALDRPGSRGRLARQRLHDSLWQWLHGRGEVAREVALRTLEQWAGGASEDDSTGRPMDAQELLALIDGGLIDIGAHSVSHPLLTRLPIAAKAREIAQSREDCARLTGHLPSSFAFPNGDLDDECVALVREAGFGVACTSQSELVWATGDRYRVPRIFVSDGSGAALMRRLRLEWLP